MPVGGAAHKPGAIALRPLRLGDIFDGAFRIIRFNPKATVGAAALVGAVAAALPVTVSTVLALTTGGSLDALGSGELSAADRLGVGASFVSLGAGLLLLQIGLLLVTGVVAQVTHEAAAGRKITLGEAWALTRGRRWRLVGLVVLITVGYLAVLVVWVATVVGVAVSASGGTTLVYGLLSGVALAALLVLLYVRLALLAVPALMLERIGVLAALGRSWRLSRGQFWRILAIALLAGLVTALAGYVVAIPLTITGQVAVVAAPDYALVLLVLVQALSTLLSSAFTTPFSAAVTTLQYLDQRMRKEAYDVTLMTQAGITGT